MDHSIFSRRSFVTACATSGALSHSVLAKGPLAGRIKISVKYHMINIPDLSVVGKFQILKELGFHGVELKTEEKVQSADIFNAINKTGVQVHGIVNAGSPDIVSAIKRAVEFGAGSVLVFAGDIKDLSYEEKFELWQSRIREVLPMAESANVKLCIENVRATFLKEAEEMARFIDSFESDLVKSYFDLGNTITWTEQSAQHWAEVLGHRIHKLDIKDRGHPVFGEAKLKREGAVGTNGGEVHWEKVRAILEQHNFTGWAAAEVRGGDRERLAGIAQWMRDVLDLED